MASKLSCYNVGGQAALTCLCISHSESDQSFFFVKYATFYRVELRKAVKIPSFALIFALFIDNGRLIKPKICKKILHQ